MLKKRFFGIMILMVGLMLIFALIGCANNDNSNINNNNNNNSGIGAITSLSVKTKGIKSLYAGNLAVKGNSTARAIVNGNGDISTLTYIDENGKPAPVIFTSPSGKQYMLEIAGMDKIDDKRIVTMYSGIYEVTAVEEGNTIGSKEDRQGGALIDMSTGKVYEFPDVWITNIRGDDRFCHAIFFIEDNICYLSTGYPNTTMYKIDLTETSPQRIPLSSGAFTPIETVRPTFTIDGKLIGLHFTDNQGNGEFYAVDSTGVRPPAILKWATLPVSTVSDTEGVDYPVILNLDDFWDGLIMKDLSGNAWMYTHYGIPYKGDIAKEKFENGFNKWWEHYIIAQLNVDNNGNYVASNVFIGDLNFSAEQDQYFFQIDESGKADYIAFYINDAGIALSSYENPNGSSTLRQETFLHNGVYLLNTKGFIKITKKQNGIEQTSVALNIPKVTRGTAVISKDGYLYWVETGAIKRLKLESGKTPETVYSNSQIVVSSRRDCLTVSGSDTLIFYQYITVSLVHTYALNLNNIYAPIRKLAENDVEIKAVAELNF